MLSAGPVVLACLFVSAEGYATVRDDRVFASSRNQQSKTKDSTTKDHDGDMKVSVGVQADGSISKVKENVDGVSEMDKLGEMEMMDEAHEADETDETETKNVLEVCEEGAECKHGKWCRGGRVGCDLFCGTIGDGYWDSIFKNEFPEITLEAPEKMTDDEKKFLKKTFHESRCRSGYELGALKLVQARVSSKSLQDLRKQLSHNDRDRGVVNGVNVKLSTESLKDARQEWANSQKPKAGPKEEPKKKLSTRLGERFQDFTKRMWSRGTPKK